MKWLVLLSVLLLPLEAQASCGFDTAGTGITDQVLTNYTTSPGSSGESYSFWVYVNSSGGGGRVMNKGGTLATVDAITSTPGISFFPAFTTTRGNFTTPVTGNNTWHNIVITYNGSSTSNVPTMYVDGTSTTVTTATAPVGTRTSDSGAYDIGNSTGQNRVFDGRIAEYAMWSGVQLTANQASALYHGASPLKIDSADLALYLPLYCTQTSDADWGPHHATSTVTGALQKNHSPGSFFPLIQGLGQ